MRRNDPRLSIITEAIERLIPGSTPAFLNVQLTETFPLARRASTNSWTGTPAGLAERIFTALYGRPRVSAEDAERDQLQTITRVLTEPKGTGPALTHDDIADDVPVLHLHGGSGWMATVEQVAAAIHTALCGRPATTVEPSPLARSDAAHARRDIGAMVDALTHADHQLTHAPWYPVRPGDLVHVHYEQAGDLPAFGEMYVVGDAGEPGDAAGGLLSMVLLAHTLPDTISADQVRAITGHFEAEAADDPLYTAWFEAGPQRLAIVRDGRVVHNGGAR